MPPDPIIIELHEVCTIMADDVYNIRTAMTGKGVSPANSPLVESKLLEIENKLRMLGANPDDPIPFN